MKQRFHTIIKPEANGWFVGWVEEVPGAISQGRSLSECRRNLRESLELVLETHRDEARVCLDGSCIQESIEIDIGPDYDGPGADASPPPPEQIVPGVGVGAGGPRLRGRPAHRISHSAAHAAGDAAAAGMLQPLA